ncbi:MAG: ammonia-forming cytochrome c nitrite reductase subunit c552 [Opitutales bacterium]|nr:ammonia-forming cytochrome c nitrite reductase subunit c552 [Opitutales bacterium]
MAFQRNRILLLASGIGGLLLLLVFGLTFLLPVDHGSANGHGYLSEGWVYRGSGQLPVSLRPAEFREFGPASCLECHAESYAGWQRSHHDRANRPLRLAAREDLAPFLISPAVYEKDGERFRLQRRGSDFFIEVRNRAGTVTDYPVVGLLGVDPLVNFLVALPDGRVQATTLSWDVHKKELFDSFDGDVRMEGDYGHWLGQGLNWNANCAWCHMTDFRKNLNVETLGYRSDWFSQGVTCRQCHPGSEAHVRAARAGRADVLPQTLAIEQVMGNCLSCHSRRGELTANRFQPGADYHDHFSLSLPDQPGLYFPDGQILDEVFAGASFKLSAMGHAGVTCMDCHDPHSLALKLPAMNNALCQQCHATGLRGAQVIDPEAHAFHHPLTEGGRCVDCHMPQRVYMARDPRHDHNFPIPDPFLTLELGVPNACSQCHKEESVEWAAKRITEWYGEGFHDRREASRARARLFAAAHRGEGDGRAILDYLGIENNAAWRASLTGLLGYAEPLPEVLRYLRAAIEDEAVLVRERAGGLLAVLAPDDPVVDRFLADPARAVRLATLRGQPALAARDPRLREDWDEYLAINADRPQFAFILARQSLEAGDLARMGRYLRNAVRLVPLEAEAWRQKAILHAEAGQAEQARNDLRHALSLEPRNPSLHWTYALFLAENNDLEGAVEAFYQTIALDPRYPRAHYNLIVALGSLDRWEEARQQLRHALQQNPRDPDLLNLRRWMESRRQW